MLEKNDPFSFFQLCFKVFEGHFGAFMQVFGILALVLIFNFFVKSTLLRLYNYYQKEQKIWGLSFVSALHKPLNYFRLFLFCMTLLFGLFSFHIHNLDLALSIAGILAFGWFLQRWNIKFLHYFLDSSKDNQSPELVSKFDLVSKVATLAIIFITLFLLMGVTGGNMQTLIAFGGIGGLALAFASQQVIANFFGGLMVYTTKPFAIGEWVNLPERNVEGTIEEIGWYLTRVRDFDKRPIYVPNSVFTQSIVITPSRMSHYRFKHTIGLRYSDVALVKTVIDNIKLMLLKHPSIDQSLRTDVCFSNFGPASLDIYISTFMTGASTMLFFALRQDLLIKIAAIIKESGAELVKPTHIIELQGTGFSPPEFPLPSQIND